MPNTSDKVSGFARYQEETKQKVIHLEKKAAKKQRTQQRLHAQKEKQKQSL